MKRDRRIPRYTWLKYIISRDTWSDVLFPVILLYILETNCRYFQHTLSYHGNTLLIILTILSTFVSQVSISLINKTICVVITRVCNTCTLTCNHILIINTLISHNNKSYIPIFRDAFFEHFIFSDTWPEPPLWASNKGPHYLITVD